jgi:hypothetical protein
VDEAIADGEAANVGTRNLLHEQPAGREYRAQALLRGDRERVNEKNRVAGLGVFDCDRS